MKKLLLILFLILAAPVPGDAYKFASGSYGGNSGDDRTIDISDTTTPSVADFQPEAVFVKCNSTTSTIFRTSAMADGVSFSLAASAPLSDNIQSFVSNGFVVGTNNAVNITGQTCWYLALANDASNDLAVGSYSGNNTDPTDIVISPAFQPDFVLIKRNNSTGALPVWRTSAMAGDLSCFIGSSTACAVNQIQALNADGFQLGNATETNVSGTHYYLAIKAVSGSTFAGSFTGDTNDNRQITAPGLQPQWMIIKPDSTGAVGCFRYKAQTGDQSNSVASAATTNQIEDFLTTGFEVGTSSCANNNTFTMYYYVMREPAVAPSSNILFRRRSS